MPAPRGRRERVIHGTNRPLGGVFIFVSAKPHTDWLPEKIQLDAKAFVIRGSAIDDSWFTLERAPRDLETSVPGILAVGDVRAGTTKRCGFAVGDGSLAVACRPQTQ